MLLKKETANRQQQLANFCRSGYYAPIVGVEAERVKVYRRLVYNLIEGTLSKAYPITRKILSDEEWKDFIYAFHTQYDSKSPYLWSMPKGLWEFSVKVEYAKYLNKPYLDELLCFEWLEIEMDMMLDIDAGPYHEKGDPLDSPVLFNPHHQLHTFTYPVFSRSISDIEKHKSKYHLLLFRNQQNFQVRYIALSPIYVTLVSILQAQSVSARVALEHVGKHFNIVDQTNLLSEGQRLIEMLLEEGAILGYVPTKSTYQSTVQKRRIFHEQNV